MNTNCLHIIPETGVIVDKDNNNYILNIKNPTELYGILQALPNTFRQPYGDSTLVVLPVHEDTLTILRNQGINTAGMEPLNWEYSVPLVEGAYEAMAHQVASAAFMASHPRCYNTSTMRTGKTAASVMATDYLQSVQGVPGSILIISTVSTLTGVWYSTIAKTLPDREAIVVHGGTGSKDRIKKLRKYADYYIINYDGIKLAQDYLKGMVDDGILNIVIIDEVTHYGNYKSGRYTALNNIINGKNPVKHVKGLTGYPGSDPKPIFSICKLVNPSKLPTNRLDSWLGMTQYQWGNQRWQVKNKPECTDIIFRTMQPTIRYDKKDIMDLAPVVRQIRVCELTTAQTKARKDIIDDAMTMIETAGGFELLEATTQAALKHKLFQIALGTTQFKDKVFELDNEPRIKLLKEIIDESTSKVVIFCSYTASLLRTVEQLKKLKYTVGMINGSVTGKKRTEVFRAFLEDKDPKVLVTQAQPTAYGIELASADTMVYNGPLLKGEHTYSQTLDRISSLKQKADQVMIIQVYATIEERVTFEGHDKGISEGAILNDMFSALTKSRNSD